MGHLQKKSSAIEITSHIQWPILGDRDPVDRFVRRFETTTAFAHEGRGMVPSERLFRLGRCLRQSKLEIYETLVARAKLAGTYDSNPQRVYDEVLVHLPDPAEVRGAHPSHPSSSSGKGPLGAGVGSMEVHEVVPPLRPEVARETPVTRMTAQTALLLQGSRARDAEGSGPTEVQSVIQVTCPIEWPILRDGDCQIDRFISKFEAVIGLANDGKGMRQQDAILALGACLEGSRRDTYDYVVERARRSGQYEGNPVAVYQELLERLRAFAEGPFERQRRVRTEWEELRKGSLSALQFSPLFEKALAECEAAGLPKSQRETLLGYMDKMGKD